MTNLWDACKIRYALTISVKTEQVSIEKLAERYAHNPHVTCWHISNEYGGECYCENCEKAFRVWLKNKYGTIEAVNKAWNMEFWGHTVYDWDEIILPNALGDGMENGTDTAFAGLSVDYRRFMSDSMLENYKMERDVVRRYNPDTIITTNLMGTYKFLDYFKWAKEMDIVSWDNYPSYNTPLELYGYEPRSDAWIEGCTLYAAGADPQPAELAAL